MRLGTRLFCALAFLGALLLLPSVSSAQQTITCESNNGGRKYCGSANPGQVTLQQQLSQASCVQGDSWGVDNQGLWVDRGCRATFNVGYYDGGGNNGGTITCESNDGNRKYCGNVGMRSKVSLQRQLSNASCMRNESWGVDSQGLWVDRGCRAIFTVSGWNGGWNGGGNNNGGTVTCESNDGRRKYCGYVNGRASLQKQNSNSPCIEGQSWGVDGQGLWVDRGCRGTFYVGGNGGNNGGYNPDYGGPALSNYPRVKADTSGRGSFSGQNYNNVNITRGWVDTSSGRPSVSLSGSNNFKITFYGEITRVDGRHFTMRITGSTSGNAYGKAEIYMNGDKNEVQSISVNGDNFSGSFSR